MQSKQPLDFAILEAWRQQGADHLDPLAFHYLVALHRRLPAQAGDARQNLEKKLSAGIQAYADALQVATPDTADAANTGSSTTLGDLLHELVSRRSGPLRHSARAEPNSGAVLPPMEALEDFRKLWSQLHTRSQVRQSLQHLPTHAGPLNSSSLVYRALALMRDVSPGYLHHFMPYLDALSWLQQLHDHGIVGAQRSPPAANGRVRASSGSKPRKRREPVQRNAKPADPAP